MITGLESEVFHGVVMLHVSIHSGLKGRGGWGNDRRWQLVPVGAYSMIPVDSVGFQEMLLLPAGFVVETKDLPGNVLAALLWAYKPSWYSPQHGGR